MVEWDRTTGVMQQHVVKGIGWEMAKVIRGQELIRPEMKLFYVNYYCGIILLK